MFSKIHRTVAAQRALRLVRPLTGIRPNWHNLLASNPFWEAARVDSRNGPRVLLATSTGSNWPCSALESLLGIALTLRGAHVSFLLCDGALPACQECDLQWLPEKELLERGPAGLCVTCFEPANKMLAPLGLPILRYSEFIEKRSVSKISDVHAVSGTLRYLGRGTLTDKQGGQSVVQRYRDAAIVTASVVTNLLADYKPDVAVFHHGIYIPQGVVGDICRENNIRVVNWGPSYRKQTVLFSHNDTYHHTMIDENPEDWLNQIWNPSLERKLLDYLDSRKSGSNDWISFQRGKRENAKEIAQRLNLDLSRPIVGLLTNVIWDAQLHFRRSAFPSMLDWLFAAIDSFRNTPDRQLIIRVHPAEILGTVPSRQRVSSELASRFESLPPNIIIVDAESTTSTYDLMSLCDSVLVFGTKTALEIACAGIPVIVAGDAWCRGRGFTIDISDPEHFSIAVAALPLKRRLNEDQIQLARKYAYHFFFRRMVPLKSLSHRTPFGPYKVKVTSLDELMPGFDRGLDLLCDGILEGKPFIYHPIDHD